MRTTYYMLMVASGLLLTSPSMAVAQTSPIEEAPIEEAPDGTTDQSSDEKPVDDEVPAKPVPDPDFPPFDTPKIVEEPWVRSATVVTSCSLAGRTLYSMKLAETEIFTIHFKQCNLELGDDGVVGASIALQAKLNLDADVSRCGTFQLSMLFEGLSAGDRVRWHGHRSIVRDLVVENSDGDKKDLGYFYLHDKPVDQPIRLRDTLASSSGQMSYPDIYWGAANILQEDNTGPLATEIRKNSPILNRITKQADSGPVPDLVVALAIEAYEPRGICIYKDAASGAVVMSPLTAIAN